MNIRNLLFISMIFCAAPVVSVASSFAKASADKPEVSLTKQEQEAVEGWIKKTKKFPSEFQEVVNFFVSFSKEGFSLALDQMKVGKDYSEYIDDVIEVYKILNIRAERKGKALEKKLSLRMQKFDGNEKIVEDFGKLLQDCPLPKFRTNVSIDEGIITTETTTVDFGDDLSFSFEKVISEDGEVVTFSEGVITTEDIVKMKKLIAMCSFILKCL